MKLKKLVQIMAISYSILTLAACSSLFGKKNTDDTSVSDANSSSAQTSGIGDDSSVESEDQEQGLSKRVYYFEFDKSEVREEDKAAILANADNLVAHPNQKVLLEGHTDPRGSREYNVALGERRANAVAEMLKTKGVNAAQVRVISYGAERLATPGRTEQDYEKDRRVVLVYLQ